MIKKGKMAFTQSILKPLPLCMRKRSLQQGFSDSGVRYARDYCIWYQSATQTSTKKLNPLPCIASEPSLYPPQHLSPLAMDYNGGDHLVPDL